jgi:SAM-dependent methyltransferase
MASRGSNVERNRWLVDLLDLGPGHRVLEVGFGPGVAIAFAAEAAPAGQIVGIDHSATMVDQATARNRDAVALGRVCLHQGSAEHPPAELGRFDRIHGMNVWQFWDDQEAVIAGLVDHLHPGGVLAIGFQPRSRGATAADTDAAARCLIDQFTDAGLLDVCSHQLDLAPVPVAAVLGCHPGT